MVLAPLLHSGKFHTEAPHLSFLFQKLPQNPVITVQRSGFQAVFEPSDVFSEVQMNVKFWALQVRKMELKGIIYLR